MRLIVIALITGIFIGTIIPDIRTPDSTDAVDLPSPGNWIDKQDVDVYKDKVVINIEGAVKAGVKDTNSMDPLIDKDSELIEIHTDASNIHAGDIISFEASGNIIVHEVVETGYDNDGWYAITKGYNNNKVDPGKVRAGNLKGVVVGILY